MNNNKKLTDKEQQELNNFKKWLEAKKYSPKNQDEVKKYYAEYQKEKAQASAQQTKKAAHGTKLNYFKSLKNQCAEDEEVVYFKKGGSVRCGCKKKEDGGEIAKAQNGTAVQKFKNDYNSKKVQNSEKDYLEGRGDHKINNKNQSVQQKFKNDYSSKKVKDSENDYFNGTADHEVNKKEYKPLKQHVPTKKQQTTGTVKKIEYKKLDNKFPEKKACGSKLKKHLQGGSLNRIPFMQAGTPEGGVTTKNGVKIVLPEYMQQTQIGYPSILPGKYSGLERISPSLFNMFKTWIKGLPKSMSTSDKVALGAGAVVGNVLGYDDTHNQYIRKAINDVSEGLNPTIEWTPFSAGNIINNIINKPQPKKFKK